jgi:hypothetical protein
VHSDDTGRDLAILYSLVTSSVRLGLNPEDYLADVLERIDKTNDDELDELLPDLEAAARAVADRESRHIIVLNAQKGPFTSIVVRARINSSGHGGVDVNTPSMEAYPCSVSVTESVAHAAGHCASPASTALSSVRVGGMRGAEHRSPPAGPGTPGSQ